MQTRRSFLSQTAALGATAFAWSLIAPWARAAGAKGISPLSGASFDLAIGGSSVAVDNRVRSAVLVNNQFPGPLLRWREGDEVTINVANHLDEDTSIHWHGILLPAGMDGVPGVSFPGIAPHETFAYRFPVKQAGAYWYHSHSGYQEQIGLYGPIIIDPKDADPVAFDREHVVMLGDWMQADPDKIFRKLKKSNEAFNYQKRTVGDFFRDAGEGFKAAFLDRAMWGGMRMSPTDIADVTGAVYAYLINGHGPGDNWTGLFNPGERVRLRIINASAMTIFNLRIPGLPMTVVQADGVNVEPVEIDEFQIGCAETYDVIIRPDDRAYTLFAETIDRSGFARATLAPRPGMSAEVPALRERPVLTMRDMAMSHGSHGGGERPAMREVSAHDAMNHEAESHGLSSGGGQSHNHPTGVGVDMIAQAPSNRLGDPGLGLENAGHRALAYAQLRSLDPNPDQRAPGRDIEIHLTGNMARYMWSFDGVKFSEVREPIMFHEGERVRVTLVNDTMMTHPIHLHGMYFDVVTGDHPHKPRKHTILVKPGDKFSFDVTADAPGEWAFHCHLLYHMAAGMMQTVRVHAMTGMDRATAEPKSMMPEDHHGNHGRDPDKPSSHEGHH